MIQRIQTVYLILVVMLCMSGLFFPLITFIEGAAPVASMTNWVFILDGKVDTFAPCALGVLMMLVILLSLMAIFLFHYRMRQIRLLVFTTILLVGYIGMEALGAWRFGEQLGGFSLSSIHINITAIFPVLSVIFNCIAIHRIRRDEALVRSLDRIR